jgi:hypothetical protein
MTIDGSVDKSHQGGRKVYPRDGIRAGGDEAQVAKKSRSAGASTLALTS